MIVLIFLLVIAALVLSPVLLYVAYGVVLMLMVGVLFLLNAVVFAFGLVAGFVGTLFGIGR